jgi:ABC-type multidrug transport system ATPase subunit
MITFANVTKRFGRFVALNQVELTVPARQAVALWGANGAGKTTLIKCLLGLLRYEGQIQVNGFDVRRDGRNARSMIGYVPQELAFYEEMSALEMARFFAQLKQVPPVEALDALAQVGLTEHAAKPVAALSGGMKQRLALGLALLGNPPVLVLDEPTSNLDAGARTQFLQLLANVKALGKTILFTSHRIEEAEALADQVVVMEKGTVQLTCRGSQLTTKLGLRTRIKLRLPGELLPVAIEVLGRAGFAAQQNGVGVLVDVHPSEKARPIHCLQQAHIVVTDFEME